MKKDITFRPRARGDVVKQHAWYVDQFAYRAAERFVDSVRTSTETIADNPKIGTGVEAANPRLQGLRSWPVKGYEAIRIYYLETKTTIDVVRILHGFRDVESLLKGER